MHSKRNNLFDVLSILFVLILLFTSLKVVRCDEQLTLDSNAVSAQNELFTIYGRVNIGQDELDIENTRILVDDGQYVAFLRSDGTFTIPGLPSNTYVVEVVSPRNVYEPVRVDINSKGKVRTRRLNLIQPSDVTVLRYPLNFDSKGYPNYFFKREQFRLMDILMSPMVLMMVVPLLLVVVLPKLLNQDPELQREFQQTTNILQPDVQNQLPSASEFFYNMFDAKKNEPNKRKKKQ